MIVLLLALLVVLLLAASGALRDAGVDVPLNQSIPEASEPI